MRPLFGQIMSAMFHWCLEKPQDAYLDCVVREELFTAVEEKIAHHIFKPILGRPKRCDLTLGNPRYEPLCRIVLSSNSGCHGVALATKRI